uniref:Uncharacterized protein n=1 Tax=Anguilla anguilla TaxID=7936 RepID=A0A0E9WCW4_ANGAN
MINLQFHKKSFLKKIPDIQEESTTITPENRKGFSR